MTSSSLTRTLSSQWFTCALLLVAMAVVAVTPGFAASAPSVDKVSKGIESVSAVGESVFGLKDIICGLIVLGALVYGATGFFGGQGIDWKKVGAAIGVIVFTAVVYTIL